jgi:hypothetical protein
MECAGRNIQSEPLLKQASHVTVSLPFATQFANEIAVGFQFRARRLWRQVGKSSDDLAAFRKSGGWLKNHVSSSEATEKVALGRRLSGTSLGAYWVPAIVAQDRSPIRPHDYWGL